MLEVVEEENADKHHYKLQLDDDTAIDAESANRKDIS